MVCISFTFTENPQINSWCTEIKLNSFGTWNMNIVHVFVPKYWCYKDLILHIKLHICCDNYQ